MAAEATEATDPSIATEVNQETPNQIQLEVQVNQQQNSETEPELPDHPSTPSVEEETPEPNETDDDPCLRYMSMLIILCIFLWPFMLTLLNYWTDFNLWLFIRSTRDEYNNAYTAIASSSTNITTLTCTFNGQNTLSSFEEFLLSNTADTQCQCNYINPSSPNWNCTDLSQYEWTTTNIEYETCVQYEHNSSSQCLQCNACAATSLYVSNAPYYLYSVELYDDIKGIKEEREKYCSPTEMEANIHTDVVDLYLMHCANACVVFFCISGIWICCGLCSGCKVRWRDLCRAYLWCVKDEKPKKRSKYHPNNTINKDEFTLFVVSTLLLHVFEDVVQCIIAIMFSIYKQSNGGSDCIQGLHESTYDHSVELVPYTGGLNVVEIMLHDDTVRKFYIFSFMHVFFTGLYGIRLLNFDVQNILSYPWWKNCGFLLCGIFMGLLFILLVLSPFWGAVWMSSDFLYLTDSETAFYKWTFIAGLGGYLVSICLPLCFADQLDCGCECGDGGCC